MIGNGKQSGPWRLWFAPLLGAAAFLLAGCAASNRNAVPKELVFAATVPGFPAVRGWGDRFSPALQKSLVESIRQARAIDSRGVADETGARNVLALSGGGPNGAFGAGFLCGWTAAGTRPVFKLVTGISTGALIAPFAFLGPDYDETLRRAYTTISTKDIFHEKSLLEILFDARSLTDNRPLAQLLIKQYDERLLADVAAAHRRGRRLFVGTTNLDSGLLMIWDMGAIAASGRPDALELFRKILLASASIPVAFPPVAFDVEAGGRHYEELHIDGGAATQVFFHGFAVNLDAAWQEAGLPANTPVRLYILRNGQLTVQWKLVLPSLFPIADRAISGLIGAQVVGDLYRIYAIATREGVEFNFASIPEDFDPPTKEPFDRDVMNQLFDLGYRLARGGYAWRKLPPGLEEFSEVPTKSASVPQP